MQIKFCYKMAKNDGSIILTANTTQENERLLHESCRKHQVENKTKEDFEKLFIKLNYICQIKSTKEEVQANSSWCNTNVINYTYGSISGFPSGSWWGIRMDCSRDRVHDPFNENIQIGPFGVTSICTPSVNLNEDIDFGNFLTFTGQKYLDGESDIDPLIKNYENQIPVRLIRSYNLLNEFAPKTGYRYDGLYIVTKFWIGINPDSTKYYKFSLLRLNDQEPPSWNTKQPLLSTSKSLSTLHCTSTHPRNFLENSSPSQYEFKKYSHTSESTIPKGKFDKSNFSTISTLQLPTLENKKIEEKEKGIPESGIVMRHVFKKGNTECTASVSTISNASENKSLNRIGMQGFKAHNTNISIRTGLYDSSHSTQHDVKKSTLSLFCRTAKSLNLLKSNQHTENSNLSNKDRNRSLDGKMQTVATNEIPKRIDYISPNAVKPDSLKIKSIKDINIEFNSSSNDTSISHCYKHEFNNIKGHKDVPNDSTDVHKSSLNSSETPTDMLNSAEPMYRNETSTHKMVPKEVQELRSIDSIESLTPDKILHLINKKCHPLSKLLMGNMIGLTSEQSIGLKTHDLLTVQSEVKDKTVPQNDIEETKEKKKFEAISDELIGARYYKFRRRRLTRKIMKKSEVRKCNRTHNGELRKGSVQSIDVLEPNLMDFNACNGSQRSISQDVLYTNTCNTDVQNKVVKQNSIQKKKIHCLQESTKNMKKNVESKIEARTRLRTMKVVKSSIKKHINKKQRREIANLLIDAKIGPKIRGPRNRRLRCIGSTYAKQSYECFSTVVCDLNKCRINSDISGQRSSFKNKNKLTKVSNYKSIRNKETKNVERSKTLNLKRNTIHENLAVSKKIDKNDIAEKILNNNNNNNSMSDNNKKLKSVKANVNSVQTNDATIIANRKRKLMETIPRKIKFNTTEKEIHEDCDKNASKTCKTDAVTQCTLIKGPLTRNLKSNDLVQKYERNEHYTFIKIEYGELKDMKSEICEATKSNTESKSQQTHKSNERYESGRKTLCNIQHPKNSNLLLNSNILNRKEQSKFSMERVSAFVPVNVLDSALKIARLRSIGFKPIISCNNGNESINNQNRGACSEAASSKVIKQNVAEKYNKYTNEENDVVVYMDDELQYQDIEDEDNNSLSSKRKASESEDCTSSDEQLNSISFERESRNDLLLEQDLELPWHGWKKVITNEDTYWVGW